MDYGDLAVGEFSASKKNPRLACKQGGDGWIVLPLQVSNLDSPDPESGVLPVTPRGRILRFVRFRRQQAI
jgi:hypothetical protein